MSIFKECIMPELNDSTEGNLIMSFIVPSLFGIDRNLDKKLVIYRKIFIRLADKAIYEYSLARENIIKQMNSDNSTIYFYFLAVNHLENCINSIRRLFYLFDRIKSIKENPLVADKILKKLMNSYFSQVKDIRNLIEHIDDYIHQKKLIEGKEPISLDIDRKDASKVSIGKYNLSLIDLANIITKFYEIASKLIKYRKITKSSD